MEYPVAVLREADRGVLQTDSQSVLLSTGSLTEHLAAHPEIGLSDYQKLQALIDRSEIYVGADDTRVILLAEDGVHYRGAVKVDQARRRVDLLTWFRTNETSANRDVRQAMRRLR